MYEYHRWITIRVTPGEIDNEQQKLREISDYTRNLIEDFDDERDIAGLHFVNGECFAWFSGSANHSSSTSKILLDIFKLIENKAPGSYGLLYVWDNEIPELNNEFQVWRLVRGKFELFKDKFLSPCIPKIEDSF
ncbi:MAG: hypothetical protein KI793_29745 [Rivularia sp. (in: Bacteria)]|nr:hypothetical protein [Rivularia sp. MS3]